MDKPAEPTEQELKETEVANQVTALIDGDKFTAKQIGAILGLVMFRIGYAAALQDVDSTVMVALAADEDEDDGGGRGHPAS